jgi:hypothetical protein
MKQRPGGLEALRMELIKTRVEDGFRRDEKAWRAVQAWTEERRESQAKLGKALSDAIAQEQSIRTRIDAAREVGNVEEQLRLSAELLGSPKDHGPGGLRSKEGPPLRTERTERPVSVRSVRRISG